MNTDPPDLRPGVRVRILSTFPWPVMRNQVTIVHAKDTGNAMVKVKDLGVYWVPHEGALMVMGTHLFSSLDGVTVSSASVDEVLVGLDWVEEHA